MNRKLNCWEFNNCGREPGGLFADQFGVCPVSEAMNFDGINAGRAAGRACWAARQTLTSKLPVCDENDTKCHECTFYRRVLHEEKESTSKVLTTNSRKELLVG